MGRWLALCVLFVVAPANAGCWVDLPLGSRHSDRDAGYNEHNYGLGVDCRMTRLWGMDVDAVAGEYRNSLREDTWYAGADLIYARPWGVELGFRGALATGYSDGVAPLPPIPIAKIRGKRWGVGVLFVPPVIDSKWVVGYWLSFAF